MPDVILILGAVGAAAVLAAALVLLGAWLGRMPQRAWASAGGVLGVGLGFLLGCWVLGEWPNWPPQEDKDRLMLILWPAVVGVELLAVVLGRFRDVAWVPRVAVAGGAAWVLLYQTVYLTDIAGPGSREWTPGQTWLILGALAISLAGVWAALAGGRSAPRTRLEGFSVPFMLALVCGGAALTVMLSGYATGGQLGLVLAGALAGAAAASLCLAEAPDMRGVIGLGVVGLFALLVIGRFFGQLTWGNAVLLFFAPLLGWLAEWPRVLRARPLVRGGVRVALAAVPVVVALVLAQQKFVKDSEAGAGETPGNSVQDYLDFGK